MRTFDFFILFILTIGVIFLLVRKYVAWADKRDERFLENCYEPRQPNKLKAWFCKRQNHSKHGQYHIETNNGAHKVKCLGCGTVFLSGRQIKVKMNKI